MSKTQSLSSEIGRRYATALLDLAGEQKSVEKIEADLNRLAGMVESSPELRASIRNPLISRASKRAVVLELAAKAGFQKLTVNFLGVVAQNGRLPSLEGIIRAVQDELAQRRGQVVADVRVAQDLGAEQIRALQDSLSQAEGKDVSVRVKVEPQILGGMIVTLGSTMIDDSVRGKLNKMQTLMAAGSNESGKARSLSAAK